MKTKILAIIGIILAIGKAVADYLQGHPIDYQTTVEQVMAALAVIFLRSGVDKAAAKAIQEQK